METQPLNRPLRMTEPMALPREDASSGLARAGLARKLHDQRAVGSVGEFVEESFHCRNVGEAMQAFTVDAKFADRLRPPQHQHCEEGRRLLRHVHHAFNVVRVSRNAFAAPLDGQKLAFQAVDRRPGGRGMRPRGLGRQPRSRASAPQLREPS